MKRIVKITFMVLAITFFFASCTKDLNTTPIDPNSMTPANVYKNITGYKQVLAKLYAGLAVSGQQGPAGKPDIKGIDEGFGEYLRAYWEHQELPTDEAVIGWNDQTIKSFHGQSWASTDVFVAAMYYRIFYQICVCNEFIRESTDSKLAERGISGADKTEIEQFRFEARFLRELSYYHALDLFGSVPYVDENDPVGKFFPQQITRKNLFDSIEKHLLDIEPKFNNVKGAEYGRAGQAAVQTLLAKLYLNAEVYTGQSKYIECVSYCEKVMNAPFELDTVYKNIFLADNYNSPEIIFPIAFDGVRTQTWGGTTFIIHAAVGGSMPAGDFGIGGGWGGTRTTSALVGKFPTSVKSQEFYWSSPKPLPNLRDYAVLYVPGSYQGWDPAKTTTVLKSTKNDNKFEGYLNFTDASTQFKFCTTPDWSNDYGDTSASATMSGFLAHSGHNIVIADAGYYKINADMTALTYTAVKTTWGVIGDATPGQWTTDTPMTYDPATDIWTVTLDLTAAGLKFRANSDWAINLGDTSAVAASGILKQDGANITIPVAGNYIVTMKLGAPDYTYTIVLNVPPPPVAYDHRAMFWTSGQSIEIKDIGTFTDGYAITKFSNMTSTGQAGSSSTFCDTDFPLFRLADVYLMYAEAVKRGGGGSEVIALEKINELRTRAYHGSTSGNIAAADLTLDFILDERARELYWEGYRRTDLIRYGQFTDGTYVWPWKGGSAAGNTVQNHFNLFPIPAADVSANPNLHQNTGY